jgi:hypothetical protein
MRPHAKLLPIAVLGLLAGCVGSDKPLSKPVPSAADKPLYGRWVADRGDYYELVEFASPTDATPKTDLPNQRLMVMSCYKRTKDGRTYARSDRRAFVTKADGKMFLNAYTEKSKGAVPCPPREFDIPAWFEFNKYKLEGDTLDLWTMDDAATLRAVRKGVLRGEEWPKDDPNSQGVWVEGGRPLLDFLTGKDGEGVFPNSGKVRYKRAKDKER